MRLEGGIDAFVTTDGTTVWRGQRINPPPASVRHALDELQRHEVIQPVRQQWTCGSWWWLEAEFLPDALPAAESRTWEVLARCLAEWHLHAPVPGDDAPVWELPAPLDSIEGPRGWCHWDLHEDNVRGANGKWYIIDCWSPVAGPLNLDLAVVCGYAVAMTGSLEMWSHTAAAYRDAGGPASVDAICPLHGLQVVGSYGPLEFTLITDELEQRFASACRCDGDHLRFTGRPAEGPAKR